MSLSTLMEVYSKSFTQIGIFMSFGGNSTFKIRSTIIFHDILDYLNANTLVAANLAHSSSNSGPQQINQSVSNLEPVSLTILLSFLRASLACQQLGTLIQGALCRTSRIHVQVSTRVDLNDQRAIAPNFFRTNRTFICSCLDNNTPLGRNMTTNWKQRLSNFIYCQPLHASRSEE